MPDFDVAIIGSGPAGGMAAIQCAKAGLDVALFEREALPRRKVCAGGIVKRAIDLLPDDLDYPVESLCDTVELQLHNPDKSFIEKREGLVTMVSRVDFDYALIKHAQAYGAKIFDDTPVKKVGPHKNHVEIETIQQTYKVSYLVLAEGANARISNCFWSDERVLVPAIEAEIFSSPDQLARFKGIARFDFDIVPSGYAWVFPKKDHISVGLCNFLKTKTSINESFVHYKKMIGLPADHEERNKKGFVIPVKPRKAPYMKQRMLLVGDAAGFADPITAEGFTYALKSGLEAGNAIASGRNAGEIHQFYNEAIHESIVQELNLAARLSKAFYVSQKLRKVLFDKYGERLCRGMTNFMEGKVSYVKTWERNKSIARLIMGK
jgi:geranylgeranyl reductase family protein